MGDATQEILNTVFLLFFHGSSHESGWNGWLPFFEQLSKIGHVTLFMLLSFDGAHWWAPGFEEIKNSLHSGHGKTLYLKNKHLHMVQTQL